MQQLEKAEEAALELACRQWCVFRVKTEDNCTAINEVAALFEEDGIIDDAANTVYSLVNKGYLALDEEMAPQLGYYYPTALGIAYYDDMMGYTNNEPTYHCLCRGAGYCIQCKPSAFF